MCQFHKSLNAPVPYHTFYQDIKIKLTLLSSWPIILSDSLLGQLPAWVCIVYQKHVKLCMISLKWCEEIQRIQPDGHEFSLYKIFTIERYHKSGLELTKILALKSSRFQQISKCKQWCIVTLPITSGTNHYNVTLTDLLWCCILGCLHDCNGVANQDDSAWRPTIAGLIEVSVFTV